MRELTPEEMKQVAGGAMKLGGGPIATLIGDILRLIRLVEGGGRPMAY